jgi:hypothetical protein
MVLVLSSVMALSQTLPVITSAPANLTVSPGNTATFNVTAMNATGYQWRFNGADMFSATNASLQVANPQTTNTGYYNVIVKNSTGWVPSPLAWLEVIDSNGIVPLSNIANSNSYLGQAASIGGFAINGSAQVMAGPALDQMKIVGGLFNKNTAPVSNGWYNLSQTVLLGPPLFGSTNINKTVTVPNVAAGQSMYYAVYIAYTNNGITYTQQSTIVNITAGGNGYALPSVSSLQFPTWGDWPEPIFLPANTSGRNLVCVPGETAYFTNIYYAFGMPYGQWRKDGNFVPGATNYIEGGISGRAFMTLTNLQPSDAGFYEFILYGDNWIVSPGIALSVQTTNGQGVFQKPKFSGTNFICDLVGAASRNYDVQQSTNLLNWTDLFTLSNASGTVTFTNSSQANRSCFYRTVLLP